MSLFCYNIIYTNYIMTLNIPHPLNNREQNYVLNQKLLTIHSEDRDTSKWPNSNQFEINLPQTIQDIQSLRLMEVTLPINYYVFTNSYQNTKFMFYLKPTPHNTDASAAMELTSTKYYRELTGFHTVTINEGSYIQTHLAQEIENQLNMTLTRKILEIEKGLGVSSNITYTYFHAKYNNVDQKIYIGNQIDDFELCFDMKIDYDIDNCDNVEVWDFNINWGLPYYIGYDKKRYKAIKNANNNSDNIDQKLTNDRMSFTYLSTRSSWIPSIADNPGPLYLTDFSSYYVKPDYPLKIFGERAIYMEIDKYNTYDELDPYSTRTNHLYNNDFNGRVNSAFAKIPVSNIPVGEINESRNNSLQNIVCYNPPIERISKLKFKFRYHDGRLVDFKDAPFNFTIAFNCLQNEISRALNVRVPYTIGL